jgi:Uma2 family endonuclease
MRISIPGSEFVSYLRYREAYVSMSPPDANPVTYLPDLPALAVDMPVLFEDEGQEQMGESFAHTQAAHTIYSGVQGHLTGKQQTGYRAFADLDLYYHPTQRWAYLSPDVMVVRPTRHLDATTSFYRIGADGPAPLLVVEVLSRRSVQQQDLTLKPTIYAQLGVVELLLVDPTGHFLPQKLVLKRLQRDETWADQPEADGGGMRSLLGFTVLLEPDGQVRVVDTQTRRMYPRPEEMLAIAAAWSNATEAISVANEARRRAEEQLRQVEGRLRSAEDRLRAAEPSLTPAPASAGSNERK